MRRKSWLAHYLNIPMPEGESPSARHWQLMRQLERRRVLAADITGVTVSPDPIFEGDTVTVAATATGIGPLEFDWMITRDSTPIADGFTSSINFNALEDGIYTVDLRVTDQADQISDTLRFEILVLNADPQVSVPFDQQQLEGSPIDLTGTGQRPYLATFTDTGIDETYTATVDWGDGNIEQAAILNTGGSYAVVGSHVYADNGPYSVTVTVTDSGGGVGMGTFGVTIRNVAPLLEVVDNQTVVEGSPLSITDLGRIRDPGFDNPIRPGGPSFETFTYTVDWGDGTAVDQGTATIDVIGAPGVFTRASFDGSHIYADNGTYTVTVTVLDDDGGPAVGTFQVVVSNALPTLLVPQNQTVAEGSLLTLENIGTISDPGFDNPDRPGGPSFETFTYSIDWGDGSAVEQGNATIDQIGGEQIPTLASFDGSHIYADNGTYTVTVTIMDDDDGMAIETFDVVVSNVAPVLTVGGSRTVAEGAPLSITDIGTISDPGFDNPDRPGGPSFETFTYTINWGDGSAIEQGSATIDQIGGPLQATLASFDGSHVYADNGSYLVTVKVVDDDGGESSEATFTVTVFNVAPTLDLASNHTIAEGESLDLTALGSISDPGFDNPNRPGGPSFETFSYTVDWGDGTPVVQETATIDVIGEPGILTQASFVGGHVYADNGTYTVSITVVDDDGGETTETILVTVTNVAPILVGGSDPFVVDEGAPVTLDQLGGGVLGLADPGFDNPLNIHDPANGGETSETFIGMSIDWGDGTTSTPLSIVNRVSGGPGVPTTASFAHDEPHYYADNGTYTVTITFSDDDGGVTSGQFTILVENVAPKLVLTDESFEIDEGGTVTIDPLGMFTDPGFNNPLNSFTPGDGREVSETFMVTIDWNDGHTTTLEMADLAVVSGSPGIHTAGTIPLITHTYADNDADNIYNVVVTVWDDDGGFHSQVLDIRVNNVNPFLEPLIATDVGSDGITTVTISFYDPGADTFDFYIDWGDGMPVLITDAHTGSTPYTMPITHYYDGPPDPNNPAGDITIRIQIRDDDSRIAGVVEDGFGNFREITIKQPGTNPNPDIITFPVPLEAGGMALPERVEQVPTVAMATSPTLQSQVPDVRSGGGDVAATSDRYFILVVVNPDGTLGDRYKLPDEALNDLVGLFARLHDDHYRIYLVQTENQSYRLVIDVVTRDGRMTVPGDASSGLRDRPPEAVDVAPPAGEVVPEIETPARLAPGELLERIEAPGESMDPEADPTSRHGDPSMFPHVATSDANSTMAVATAALAAAVVAIDPREDWAVRLERAFASADPRRWRRLRRRRPR